MTTDRPTQLSAWTFLGFLTGALLCGLLAGAFSGCATAGPPPPTQGQTTLKQQIVFAHGASVAGLRGFQDAEIAVFESGIAPFDRQTHVAIQRVLRQTFAAQDAAGAALQFWKQGQPIPSTVDTWLMESERTVTEMERLIPPADARYAALWTQLRNWGRDATRAGQLIGAVVGAKTLLLGQGGAR